MQKGGKKLCTILNLMVLNQKLYEVGFIDPEEILSLLHKTARKKLDVIKQAVNGRMNGHDRAFLSMLVSNYEQSLKEIEDVKKEIYACAQKYEPSIALLETIPGSAGWRQSLWFLNLGQI